MENKEKLAEELPGSEEKEHLSETMLHKIMNMEWLNGIEEKPRKIKGTPDVNIEPTTKRAKFLRFLWSYF